MTVFPLTDDYALIEEQLAAESAAFNSGVATPNRSATGLGGRGSSLIGDGLVSCLQAFDRKAEERPRTVVLATDNEVAGDQLFSLPEAVQMARERQVTVFGIVPNASTPAARELDELLAAHGWGALELNPEDTTAHARITSAIKAQQRRAILGLPSSRSFDLVWPWALVALLALWLSVLAQGRGRR